MSYPDNQTMHSEQRNIILYIRLAILIVLTLIIFLTTDIKVAEPITVQFNSKDSVLESSISIPKPNIEAHKQYAYSQVVETWSEDEWKAFDTIIKKESNWRSNSQNPTSTAYGLGQFLDSTWKLVGCTKTSDPDIQIDCTITYIQKTYGTPRNALYFHSVNNFY